jgi:hypothetical protein
MPLNWPAIGLLFILIGMGPKFFRGPAVEVQPTGVYSLGTHAVSGPVADGSRVSVATQDGLVAIDFSDTAGVLRVRMRATGSWEATQIVNLGPLDSRVRIERWQMGPGYRMGIRPVPQFELAVRGTYAYLAGFNVLLTLDLGDPSRPRVVHRTEFDDAAVLPTERKIARLGNRLYVESFRPPMLRRYDLQDPSRPVEMGRSVWRPVLGGALVADEAGSTLSVAWRDGVLTFPPPEGLWIHEVRYLKGSVPGSGSRTQSPAAADGLFYLLLHGDTVAAYPVPR